MIWVLYAPFSIEDNKSGILYDVFLQVFQEYQQQTLAAKTRVDEVKSKREFLDCIHEIQKTGAKISEWHFIGYGTPYGPLLGSQEWPEEISRLEWESINIPFSSQARAWLYTEGSARWFAPFIASHYKITSYGYHHLSRKGFSAETIFQPGYWKEAADYNPIAELYAAAFTDITVRRDECRWLESRLQGLSPRKVLDIGCGNGALLAYLAPKIKEGMGVDVSSAAVEIASQRCKDYSHLSFYTTNGLQLPISSHSVDVVISMLSFRYLDWDPVIQEIKRVLIPGGSILIVDMVGSPVRPREWLAFLADKLKNHRHRRKHQSYAKSLSRLVTHPAWHSMIHQHPMHNQNEFSWYLQSRFPEGKMTVINTGAKAKILAFDSGPVNKAKGEKHGESEE